MGCCESTPVVETPEYMKEGYASNTTTTPSTAPTPIQSNVNYERSAQRPQTSKPEGPKKPAGVPAFKPPPSATDMIPPSNKDGNQHHQKHQQQNNKKNEPKPYVPPPAVPGAAAAAAATATTRGREPPPLPGADQTKRVSRRGGSPGVSRQAAPPSRGRDIQQQQQQQQQQPPPRAQPRSANATFDDVYMRGKQLGSGAFAKVFIAIEKGTRTQYAVKEIDRSKMKWGGRDALEDEIQNLKKLVEAPNCVKFQDVFYKSDICYLVLELLEGGELFGHIISKGIFTEAEARDSCRCILQALDYMHDRRMVHRDLKPENLLLTGNMDLKCVKLSDFGFSKTLAKKNSCRTLCGTPGYLAPEILERWPAYDVNCDTFSFGVIMFLLLGGYLPFDPHGNNDINQVFDATRNGKYHFYPQRWKEISFQAKDLVAKCLAIAPGRRLTSKKALEHEWIGNQSLVLNVNNLAVSIAETVNTLNTKQERAKKAAAAAAEKGRLEELNDDFTVFMDQRKGDSIVSHMTGANRTVATQGTQFKEDGPSGKPFSNFYKLGDALGEGGFAQVYRCTHKKTGLTYAVKDVSTDGLSKQEKATLHDEIVVLKFLRGAPFIVRLYDVFKEPHHTYLVLEEMKGGDLLNRICDKEVYTEYEARELCQYFFEAVAYCHQKKIAHRDIKLDNLLLMEEGNDASIKLADFGFAKRSTREKALKTLCGTPNYMAPEIFDLKTKYYDYRCDMWSAGVVVYALIGGYLPFEGNLKELAAMVTAGQYYFHDEYWTDITPEAKGMVKGLLQVKPDARLSAQDALACKWMGLDDEDLTVSDLSQTQQKMKSMNTGKEKMKNAVRAIMGANKMASVAGFKHAFQDSSNLENIVESDEVEEEKVDEKFEDLFDLGEEVGDGVYGRVYIATEKQTKAQYAAKRVIRRTLHPSDVQAVEDEIAVLKEVSSCNQIIKFQKVYEDEEITTIVMEHFGGQPLIDRLIESKKLTEFYAKEVVRNLMLGVAYCHKKRIANRNLKLDNILLPDNSKSGSDVKICDFEFAKKLNFPNSLRTQCGTQEYCAPEILANRPAYDVPCDMWSVGVMIFIMLGGYYPFRGTTEGEVLENVRYGQFKFREKYWKGISQDAKDLIARMLVVDPDDRITASDALKSSWIGADDKILSADLSENMREFEKEVTAKLKKVVKTIIATNLMKQMQQITE